MQFHIRVKQTRYSQSMPLLARLIRDLNEWNYILKKGTHIKYWNWIWMLTSCKMSSSFGITQSSSEASLMDVRVSGRERKWQRNCYNTGLYCKKKIIRKLNSCTVMECEIILHVCSWLIRKVNEFHNGSHSSNCCLHYGVIRSVGREEIRWNLWHLGLNRLGHFTLSIFLLKWSMDLNTESWRSHLFWIKAMTCE